MTPLASHAGSDSIDPGQGTTTDLDSESHPSAGKALNDAGRNALILNPELSQTIQATVRPLQTKLSLEGQVLTPSPAPSTSTSNSRRNPKNGHPRPIPTLPQRNLHPPANHPLLLLPRLAPLLTHDTPPPLSHPNVHPRRPPLHQENLRAHGDVCALRAYPPPTSS